MNLIGKKVTITTRDSIYFGEWGTIIDFDGEYYYVAIADDKTSVLMRHHGTSIVGEKIKSAVHLK